MRRDRLRSQAVCAGLCALSLFAAAGASAIAAQTETQSDEQSIRKVEPRRVVVSVPEAVLRSGELERFYAVARLREGAQLTVIGEGDGWYRVRYPSRTGAFVAASEARLEEQESRVRLTAPTRLKAPNEAGGYRMSWRSVLDEPVPAGEHLRLIEVVRDDSGRPAAYRVVPPEHAGVYIRSDHVTESPRSGAEGAQALATPERRESERDESRPQADRNENDRDETQQDRDRADEGRDEGDADRQTDEQADETPVVIDQGERSRLRAPETATLNQLDNAYDRLRQGEGGAAELDALLGEYRAALDATEESPFTERLRGQLRDRIAMIRLRIQMRDRMASLTDPDEDAADTQAAVQRFRDAVASGRHDFVGRLSASPVYNGDGLPRLFAVRSATGLDRILGYIDPAEVDRAHTLVGRVVGIHGAVDATRRSGAKIIRVDRIEPLPDPAAD